MSGNCSWIACMIFAMTLASSCTKSAEGITGPAGPAGAAGRSVTDQRSAITGYVVLATQFTATDSLTDSVEVSTVMGDSALSVLTDKTGKFVLPGLKSGTYRIMFRKAGYDSIAINIEHSAGNADQFINILQIDGTLTTRILSQDMQILPSPFDLVSKYLNLNTLISGPAITNVTMRYMDIYFSSSPDVNAHNYLYTFNTYTHNEGTNTFNSQIFFAGTNINSTRFQPGDTVYMKSYIVPPYSFDTSWFDTNTYQTVSYPYTGDSLSNYFIWPN